MADTHHTHIIIGSGPAGIAAAQGLLARGVKVLMLDAGIQLEAEKQTLLGDEANAPHLRHTLSKGENLKLSYGSDYPYRGATEALTLDMDEGVSCKPSFAQGGLSNVWGACIERYAESDIADWPIALSELDEGYQHAWNTLNPTPAKLSSQADMLMQRWNSHQQLLGSKGLKYAAAELAVDFSRCTYCGECQHGCPYGLIYSARHTLESLRSHPLFSYQGDCIVDAVQEQGGYVEIRTRHRIHGTPQVFHVSRVYLACGALTSTVLAMRAANYTATLMMKDSTHFLQPCIMRKRLKHMETEKLHTLAHLMLKYQPATEKHPVNIQLYTYMNHYEARLKQLFGKSYTHLNPLLSPLTDRLIAVQCHLHSDVSHAFSVRTENDKVILRSLVNKQAEKQCKRVRSALYQNMKMLGFSPLPFSAETSKISRAFHYGGALPMRKTPFSFESDSLGRPFAFTRIHVVDAAVFPSIAAGSITPTVMANAFRITTESAHL